MDPKSRKRHPKWQYTDTGPGRMEDEFRDVKQFLQLEDFQVIAWSPDPEPGRTPPTQVHIIFNVQGLPEARFVLRLKTMDGMDAFIRLLAEYRRHVWGPQDSR